MGNTHFVQETLSICPWRQASTYSEYLRGESHPSFTATIATPRISSTTNHSAGSLH